MNIPSPLNCIFTEQDRKGNVYTKQLGNLTLKLTFNAGKVVTTMSAIILEGESVLRRMGPELANEEFGLKIFQSLSQLARC